MKNITVLVAVAALLLGCKVLPLEEQNRFLKAGASSASVNPPIGSYIAGDKQDRIFKGIHDNLYAKAVVFDDGESLIALVTVDCIGLLYPEVQRIQNRVAKLTPIPAERVVVSSTHTHSGPDVVGIWGADYQHSGVDTAYVSFLVNTAAEQVRDAYEKRTKVTVLAAETSFGEEWVRNISDLEIDRSVTTLQLIRTDGTSVATLTNFACHPTYLDAKFHDVSSDYVGGFYKHMGATLGGENLFLQGAIGGWVQPVDGEGSFEKAELRGRELSEAVLMALSKPDTLESLVINFTSVRLNLPVQNEAWRQLSAIGTIKREFGDSVETEVAWFAIGPAQFATHPGETTPYLGLKTKSFMSTGPRFVLGLSQDALGYILKPEYFDDPLLPHAPYLTSMSLGRETSPLLEQTMRKVIP